MKIDKNGIELLAELEGLKLKSYKCTANVWTIGLGSTYYENGERVKENETITREEAYHLFFLTAPKYEKPINDNVKVVITQNQFNALFCFCYNVGVHGFKTSTLIRVINKDPNNRIAIEMAFNLWKGKNNILLSRQQKQFKHYFK